MINGKIFKDAIISGTNNLSRHKTFINEMNIFPVPDGDTGINMLMTISSAAQKLEKADNCSLYEVSKIVSSSLLRGARGNSGVILSILFKGFSKVFEGIEAADGRHLVEALEIGVKAAYGAVMKPTEGTMLTVARVAFEKGKIAASTNSDVVHVWNEVCIGAHEALKTTPDLLPILKKAGVVDAGGKGICVIFDGMLSVFKEGKIIDSEIKLLNDDEENDEFKSAVAAYDSDIRFTYCTEFIISKNRNLKHNTQKLRKLLEKIGDCVVVVDDDEIIKVHVHSEQPDKALKFGLAFGSLLKIEINNMKEQHKQEVEKNKEKSLKQKEKLKFAEPTEDVGFVSVAAGEGIIELFTDLGCAVVISGGQTMNPSTDQILEAILATPAKHVYVFPNNKNIILAAEQAAALTKDRTVTVVPTKTIPQGVSSIIAYNPELSYEQNLEKMQSECTKVKTAQITFAARDSEFGGFKIKENDILALNDGKLMFVDKNPVHAIVKLVKMIKSKESEFITLIYGQDVTEAEAEEASELIKSKFKNETEITLINGKQPIYHFIASIE